MARQLLLLAALLLCTITSASTDTLHVLLHFQKDRSVLLPEAAARLDSMLAVAPLSGDHHFTVQGHTDSDGDLAYNEALSLARAEEVRSYLVARGADPSLVNVERYG
ncbi:MAG TPA: OmpA family protein, partial [Flavobacteriales bacterium]|nr:OmpA family protein [Flavobacteriales bacterium]